jgi:hypothetical protein
MRCIRSISTLAFVISFSGMQTLVAQRPDRGLVEVGPARSLATGRGGFFGSIGFGAGAESYKYSDEPEYTKQLTKPTLTVEIGGTPNRSVRLGGSIFLWHNPIDNGYEEFGTYLMTAQFYPGPKSGFFVRAGGGFARSGTSYDAGSSVYETGLGLSGGAGWELKAARNVYIAPTVDIYAGSFTKRNEPTISEHVINLGVQVLLQSGRR